MIRSRSASSTLLLLAFLGAAAASAFDGPTKTYEGAFELHPQVMHPNPTTGKLALFYDGDTFVQAQLALDKPIAGKTAFASTEQWAARTTAATSERLVVAFKLMGPPHKWYFVQVSESSDGGLTFDGPIYKAPSTLAEIQQFGVSPDAQIPASWKNVGNATLKAQ